MKTIILYSGQKATVDDKDYPYLKRFKWHYVQSRKSGVTYACRREGSNMTILMHREILGALNGQIIDHKNGDGLDNRRSNLRFATSSENGHNSKLRIDNRSGYKGVYWNKKDCRWRAQISDRGKRIYLGSYKTPQLAFKAYCEAAVQVAGEFIRI